MIGRKFVPGVEHATPLGALDDNPSTPTVIAEPRNGLLINVRRNNVDLALVTDFGLV